MCDDTCEHRNPKCKDSHSIWDIYNQQAQKRDDDLAEDWEAGIANLLIFAGIFAAAVTSLCVETRKMLEPDPQVSTQTILLAIAAKMDNNSLSAVPTLDYEPEAWQVQVNYLFFISLTASLVASLGGIICLQWVGGYNYGIDTGGNARMRALQRHSRYKAAKKWYMRHFIVGLHLLLFCAVIFFLAGLSLWFWHVYRILSSIPLLGLLIWVVGYLITTLLAAVHPFAPYRNAISRFLFRILSMLGYWWWSVRNVLPCVLQALYRVLSQTHKIPRSYGEWRDISGVWSSFWEEFRLDRTLAVQSFVKRVTTGYPWDPAWMANSKTYWVAMHSYLWELGKVDQDKTLPLSTLAWLARKLGHTKPVVDDLTLLIKELSLLEPIHLQKWKTLHFDAPWMPIINSILRYRKNTSETRYAVPDVLLKMTNNPKLFERFVPEMEKDTVEFLLQQLAAKPLRIQQSRASIEHYEICGASLDSLEKAIINQAENRLTSLTALLASNLWICQKVENEENFVAEEGSNSPNPTPHELIPGILLDALERCTSISPSDTTTLWVFTIYRTAHPPASDTSQSPKKGENNYVARWPNPLIYGFPWRAFAKPSLRVHAIAHYIAFLELYLTGKQIDFPGMELQWRVPAKDPETTRILTEILTHHLLRLHANAKVLPDLNGPVGSLLVTLQSKLTCPALKLIWSIMDLDGLFLQINIPRHYQKSSPDAEGAIWQDTAWKQAVLFWCGVRPGWSDETCAIKNVSEDVIQKAFDLFETLVRANDVSLNTAAEVLVYRLAPHLEMMHWVQFISVFFHNRLRGYPTNVSSQIIGLIFHLSPTSAIDRLRETIYAKIILSSRRARKDPLQRQMERVSGGDLADGKMGVIAWYQLISDYSMERRIKEIEHRPKLRFQVKNLLDYILDKLQGESDPMDLDTSHFRTLLALFNAATRQYIRLVKRQERLEENARRIRSENRQPELNLGMEKLQQEKSEQSLSFRTVGNIVMDLALGAKEQIKAKTIDTKSQSLEAPGIQKQLKRRRKRLQSIHAALYIIESSLREKRAQSQGDSLTVKDPSQIEWKEIPPAWGAMERTSLKVKDIPLMVGDHWNGWMYSLKNIPPLGYMQAADPLSRCRCRWDLP